MLAMDASKFKVGAGAGVRSLLKSDGVLAPARLRGDDPLVAIAPDRKCGRDHLPAFLAGVDWWGTILCGHGASTSVFNGGFGVRSTEPPFFSLEPATMVGSVPPAGVEPAPPQCDPGARPIELRGLGPSNGAGLACRRTAPFACSERDAIQIKLRAVVPAILGLANAGL